MIVTFLISTKTFPSFPVLGAVVNKNFFTFKDLPSRLQNYSPLSFQAPTIQASICPLATRVIHIPDPVPYIFAIDEPQYFFTLRTELSLGNLSYYSNRPSLIKRGRSRLYQPNKFPKSCFGSD